MKAKSRKFHLVAVLNDEDFKTLTENHSIIGKVELLDGNLTKDIHITLTPKQQERFVINGPEYIISSETYNQLKDQGYAGLIKYGIGRVDLYTEKQGDNAQVALDELN